MSEGKARRVGGGVNQSGVRNYNERLLMSMIQRNGPMPGSDLARQAGLSAQTVSVILRELEQEGLLIRGAPQRGKVGKPSRPMALAPSGTFSFGLKIGRRSADLALMDFLGNIRKQLRMTYRYTLPDAIFGFLREGIGELSRLLSPRERARLSGIGLAVPFELWKWDHTIGAPAAEFTAWREVDFADRIAAFSDLPVFVTNDATAACHAEHNFGRGKQFSDYAYFFVAAFIGGGVVMNNSVVPGNHGNAGAFGSLPAIDASGRPQQLIDVASLHLLERRMVDAGLAPGMLWEHPDDWSGIEEHLAPWIAQTARELALAALTVCAVIDFEAVLIDGGFPADVRLRLVAETAERMAELDARGVIKPRIEAGSVGGNARVIGAASAPIFAQYFFDTNAGLALERGGHGDDTAA